MKKDTETKKSIKKPLFPIALGITIFFLISGAVLLIIGMFTPFSFPADGTFSVSQVMTQEGFSLFSGDLRGTFDLLVRFGSSTNSLLLLDTALGGFSFIIIGMIFSIPTASIGLYSMIQKKKLKKKSQTQV